MVNLSYVMAPTETSILRVRGRRGVEVNSLPLNRAAKAMIRQSHLLLAWMEKDTRLLRGIV
jgi:hypothetical protein